MTPTLEEITPDIRSELSSRYCDAICYHDNAAEGAASKRAFNSLAKRYMPALLSDSKQKDKLAAKLLTLREEFGPLLRMIEEGAKVMVLTVSPKGTCSHASDLWDKAKARELLELLSEEEPGA